MPLPLERALTLAATARPGVTFRPRPEQHGDELVLLGGGEVLRLPLTPEGAARQAVLVRGLPALRSLVPVAVPAPRYVGVLDDGVTPFTAEARLPGVHPTLSSRLRALDGIALGQLAGLLAALAEVAPREAEQWGVTGAGRLRHGALDERALLVDPQRGVLVGVVGWRPLLGDPADDLASLPAALRPH